VKVRRRSERGSEERTSIQRRTTWSGRAQGEVTEKGERRRESSWERSRKKVGAGGWDGGRVRRFKLEQLEIRLDLLLFLKRQWLLPHLFQLYSSTSQEHST